MLGWILFRILIFSTGVGLVILSPKEEVVFHTISSFGMNYGNGSIVGEVIESIPFDACQPLHVNATGKIVLAIRGGSPACTFTTKVKNIELSNASAGIIMNADYKHVVNDDLVEMGSILDVVNISIPNVFITNESGQKLRFLLHENSDQSLTVCLNSTGETNVYVPSFTDLVISFLQLSVIVWISIAIMYAVAYCNSLFHVYKRRRAVHSLQTVPYHCEGEVDECTICLEVFKEGDLVKILPCKHVFHEHCAKEWVGDIRGVCPLCRRGIFEKEMDNLTEMSLNRELNELVDREALQTHSRTLIYLFLVMYAIFVIGSLLFP